MIDSGLFFIVVLLFSPLVWSLDTIKISMTTAFIGSVGQLGSNVRGANTTFNLDAAYQRSKNCCFAWVDVAKKDVQEMSYSTRNVSNV